MLAIAVKGDVGTVNALVYTLALVMRMLLVYPLIAQNKASHTGGLELKLELFQPPVSCTLTNTGLPLKYI